MSQRIRQKFKAQPSEHLLLALLWGLPLLYMHDSAQTSITARWALLVAIAAMILAYAELRSVFVKNIRSLNKYTKFALSILLLGMLISTVFASESWPLKLIGWSGENLGILSWLSFIVAAVALRTHVRSFLESRVALSVSGLVCAVSLLVDTRLLANGFRLPGLLFIATSTAIYAAFTLGLAVWHTIFDKKQSLYTWIILLASATTLILCQSRAAQFAAVAVCLLYALYMIWQKKLLALLPLAVAALLVIIPLVGGAYFTRMRGEKVQAGIAYRSDIYRLSADEIVHKHVIVGLGASGVPEAINNKSQAPPGIVETLNQNYVFLSAHDVFLDTALYFGLVAGVALLMLILGACYTLLTQPATPELLLSSGVFLVLLINGILNVPSVELTSLLFIVAFAALPVTLERLRTKKSKS